MKKFLMIALMIAVGVSFAFASSLKVPWFVDSAAPASGNPPAAKVLGLVTLTSNSDEVVVAEINYFNAGGTNVGFVSRNPDNSSNTFTIAALSSVAFRPVQIDPGTEGGQEGPQGVLIADRNTSDGKFNGSCVIKWVGGSGLVQGQVVYVKTSGNTNGQQEVVSYAHLLPTGVSSGE